MAALIAARRAEGIPVAVSCRALGISSAWFCKHKDGQLLPRALRRQRLKAEVARLFAAREGRYGSPRIAADLREAGWRVSKNTVATLMREQYLASRRRRKRKATTRPAVAGGGYRTWSSGTSPPARSTANGMAMARKFRPVRGSSTWPRCWIWPRGESSASPSASIMTRSWPTVGALGVPASAE